MATANPLHPPFPTKLGQRSQWEYLPASMISLALSTIIQKSVVPVIIITPDTLLANRLEEELLFFLEKETATQIIHFPDWETLPYDHFSPHQDIISSRLSALHHLPRLTKGGLITSISTLMQYVAPREYLESTVFLLKTGDKLSINQTRNHLEHAGYRHVNLVREHGEYAVRGSIIDIFPMGSATPYRIDLFDDEIDSIRIFSAETQRTTEKIEKIELLPAKEFPLTEEAIERFRANWRSQFSGNPLNCPMYQEISEGICPPGIEYYLPFFFDKTATLFDFLPPDSLMVIVGDTHPKAEDFYKEVQHRFEQRAYDVKHPILKPDQLFVAVNPTFEKINQFSQIRITTVEHETLHLSLDHKAAKPLANLQTFLQNHSERILFSVETAGRREVLLQLFRGIDLFPKQFDSWQDFLTQDAQYGMIVSPLQEGFKLDEPPLFVITESELFGKKIIQSRHRKESVQDPEAIIKDLTELQIGSPIVHIDHGVGRYLGLQTLKIGEQVSEFLAIEYAEGSKLYVPVAGLHLISRYSGMDPEHAPLHRLGTDHWNKAKRKAAEQVKDVAAELLSIYAQRAARPGFAYAANDEQYLAFANAFPFEETPDQAHAIEQIIIDMQSDKPMDRLVCGDVGFGKTEVAMRAAFIAAQNSKQVAVLVPTTLLAQQHYQTFQDRFADWPIRVGMMSRFRTSKENLKSLDDLANGKIDIVIGTHKILQQNIAFKALGLLIIDEEHRFGVQQKEKIKAMRANVDILTLTATPIPRTLNMAFAGMRDLSLIATPPAKRLAVKTFLHEYQDSLIQEAISREIMRGGQVYFLHNDVSSIERMTQDLVKLVPEARIGFAHGQMHERELERVMADFYHRKFNVLVCSTIIESGIDIPSANTIIINRADKFGIAQLHQLRGRVGRSHHQAYAYLLIPSLKLLTSDAKKRLDAITAYEDLGIGFTLATHDLEIRGAGELLGEGQSGEMQAIGFTLYMDLLTRAVNTLKAGKTIDIDLEKSLPHGAEIDLQIPALIPDAYLGDVHMRLQFYKRIASTKNIHELDEIQVEMIDRFGLLPHPAKNLFAITQLKQKADLLGIKKIEAHGKGGKIEFEDKPNIDPMKLIKLIQMHSTQFKLDGPTRLRFTLEPHDALERIKLIEDILGRLG